MLCSVKKSAETASSATRHRRILTRGTYIQKHVTPCGFASQNAMQTPASEPIYSLGQDISVVSVCLYSPHSRHPTIPPPKKSVCCVFCLPLPVLCAQRHRVVRPDSSFYGDTWYKLSIFCVACCVPVRVCVVGLVLCALHNIMNRFFGTGLTVQPSVRADASPSI